MKINLSSESKIGHHFFLLSLAVLNIIITFDDYMYFAASPQITAFYKILPQDIDNLTRANLYGVLFGSIFISFKIHKHNKKYLLLSAMLTFILCKVISISTHNFNVVVLASFISGIANSFPPTLIVLLLLQRYSDDVTNNKLLTLEVITYSASLAMPMITAFLITDYSWKMSFIFPSILGVISFILTYNFIVDKEIINHEETNKISFKDIFANYFYLARNLKFITFVFIASLPWITEILKLLSIPILLENMHVSLIKFSYAKEVITIANILFALLAIKITNSKGVVFSSNLGFIVMILGVFLFTLATLQTHSKLLLPTTLIVIMGENMLVGFNVRAITSISKSYQKVAASFIVMINSFTTIRATKLSQDFYNGKLSTNALLMDYYVLIAIFLFLVVVYKDRKLTKKA